MRQWHHTPCVLNETWTKTCHRRYGPDVGDGISCRELPPPGNHSGEPAMNDAITRRTFLGLGLTLPAFAVGLARAAEDKEGKEVTTDSGLKYVDLKVGDGIV